MCDLVDLIVIEEKSYPHDRTDAAANANPHPADRKSPSSSESGGRRDATATALLHNA
jgi:hypothetical protein